MAEKSDGGDAHQHQGASEPQRRLPSRRAQWKAQFHARYEQRYHHCDSREVLEPRESPAHVEADRVKTERPERDAYRQVNDGGRDRKPPDVSGGERHREQQRAAESQPFEVAHDRKR
jgi:hypothetical protein